MTKAEFSLDVSDSAVSNQPEEVMDFFTTMPEVEYIHTKGITKSMVRLHSGIDCDLRIVPEESFGAAFQYFTGNKQHNVVVRTIALHKGYKLNEYGLYDKRNHQLVISRKVSEIAQVKGVDRIMIKYLIIIDT
jgi:DNA polymerase (family X)